MEVIVIKDLLGTEVRSRIPANILRKQLINNHAHIIDMKGVNFISRSFADELYNICQDYGHIRFLNKNDDVKKMMDAVWTGREKKRVRPNEDGTIENISTMKDLSKFLMTI